MLGKRRFAKTVLGLEVGLLGLASALAVACSGPTDKGAEATLGYEGYWQEATGNSDYGVFLKITGKQGYMCVLDNKSSFQFKIQEDSINTPLNGMNKIELLSSPPHIRISGEEKGEIYVDEYKRMEASQYPAACVEEEKEWFGAPGA